MDSTPVAVAAAAAVCTLEARRHAEQHQTQRAEKPRTALSTNVRLIMFAMLDPCAATASQVYAGCVVQEEEREPMLGWSPSSTSVLLLPGARRQHPPSGGAGVVSSWSPHSSSVAAAVAHAGRQLLLCMLLPVVL